MIDRQTDRQTEIEIEDGDDINRLAIMSRPDSGEEGTPAVPAVLLAMTRGQQRTTRTTEEAVVGVDKARSIACRVAAISKGCARDVQRCRFWTGQSRLWAVAWLQALMVWVVCLATDRQTVCALPYDLSLPSAATHARHCGA